MQQQAELSFSKPAIVDPGVAELVEFLKGKGWMSAAQITAATGWDDRSVRELASESDYIISSPGRMGYKFIFDATADEYHRYRESRRGQARKMVGKVIRTDRIYYARSSVGAGL